jgi:A/G-specific adenine glycosylase
MLPENEPWLVVEGLIELGGTICKRNPNCMACPLQEKCFAHNRGLQQLLPKKGKKVEITSLSRRVFVIVCDEALLVKKGQAGKVMADLYEFPYVDFAGTGSFAIGSVEFPFSFSAKKLKNLPEVEHSFTRFKVKLYPSLWKISEKIELPEYDWIPWQEIRKYPFSSGHKKILNALEL